MELIRVDVAESGFVRIVWKKSDGGMHMQGITPGDNIDAHLDAVDADMEARGLAKMSWEQKTQLQQFVAKEHTARRIEEYRAKLGAVDS